MDLSSQQDTRELVNNAKRGFIIPSLLANWRILWPSGSSLAAYRRTRKDSASKLIALGGAEGRVVQKRS